MRIGLNPTAQGLVYLIQWKTWRIRIEFFSPIISFMFVYLLFQMHNHNISQVLNSRISMYTYGVYGDWKYNAEDILEI